MTELQAPHRHIQVQDGREKFLIDLFDTLWARYRLRMDYVRKYEDVVRAQGAKFINDHIAFRTLATQKPAGGIFTISRVFEALGYCGAACYEFPDKHLNSIHYRHPNPQFPKLFVTQLKTWELSPGARKLIHKSVKDQRPLFSEERLCSLAEIDRAGDRARASILKETAAYFEELPWEVPQKKDVLALDHESQFGAWVLVNGSDVNHFTASVDSHGVESLGDIEKTVAALRAAGVPMKKEIEGERGSKLRQTSTEAAVVPTLVRDEGKKIKMPWTYAYFEIAERPLLKNPATGEMERFEGFLGGQAANLFDMTKLRG